MRKLVDLDIVKRALKIFIVATICLIITTIICYFLHPSFNDLKDLGSTSEKLVTLMG